MMDRVTWNRNKLLLLAMGWMAVAVPSVFGQTGATAGAKTPAFNVVSIKPSRPDGPVSFRATPTGFEARGTTLWIMIMRAYISPDFKAWSPERLKGMPGWSGGAGYDITVKVDDATAESWRGLSDLQRQERLQPMLKAMLAERCKLVVHSIPVQFDGYALVVGRSGAKFMQTPAGEKFPADGIPMPDGGVRVAYRKGERPQFIFYGISMATLAEWVSVSGHPVQDKTGLTGRYDGVLPLTDVEDQNDPNPTARWQLDALGLATKTMKLQVDAVVIDHIERPSEN